MKANHVPFAWRNFSRKRKQGCWLVVTNTVNLAWPSGWKTMQPVQSAANQLTDVKMKVVPAIPMTSSLIFSSDWWCYSCSTHHLLHPPWWTDGAAAVTQGVLLLIPFLSGHLWLGEVALAVVQGLVGVEVVEVVVTEAAGNMHKAVSGQT